MIEAAIERAWQCAVHAVSGARAVQQAQRRTPLQGSVKVAAVGKAAPSMLLGLLNSGVDVSHALVITKDEHSLPVLDQYPQVQQLEAAHPVPDTRSLTAGLALRQFVGDCSETDQLLLLISGGASALAEQLVAGETLETLQEKTQKLLAQGADIAAINHVRRQWSRLKSGRLCARCPATVHSWLLSDVAGDDPMVIGSGIGVLAAVNNMQIIANNTRAREAAAESLRAERLPIICNEESLYGDVQVLAQSLAQRLREAPSGAYILGGEPTVLLPEHPGEGGRNQALALALSMHLGDAGVIGLVAGTDGTDGPTHAAGGWFGRVPIDAPAAEQSLLAADSGRYLRKFAQDFFSGPTGTNVMDLLIAVKR